MNNYGRSEIDVDVLVSDDVVYICRNSTNLYVMCLHDSVFFRECISEGDKNMFVYVGYILFIVILIKSNVLILIVQ